MAARIPSLDGVRGLSILLVLWGHAPELSWFPNGLPFTGWCAELGVRIFFILSGFLITTLLQREHQRTGGISLKAFYFARTLRIFPAYYFYIAVMALLSLWGVITLRRGDLLAATTYTMNYHWDRAWYLGHAWSLSVEEQFYLLWPGLLVLLGWRRGLLCAVTMLVVAPLARVGNHYLLPHSRVGIGESFPTVADTLATGCLLLYLRGWLAESKSYRALRASPLFALVPLVVLLAATTTGRARLSYLVLQPVMNLGIALCIDWCVTYPAGWVGRILNARPLAWLGGMSYSLYLWQQPFFNRHADALVNRAPWCFILALACAWLSYRYIEQPALRLRDRLRRGWRAPRT